MRVAIFDPQPRIGGGTQFALHTAAGFAALGHEVKTVAFTKSGRPMKNWGSTEAQPYKSLFWHPTVPEIVAHIDDAKVVFDSFDLIFLAEPLCHPQVAAANASLDIPIYQWALSRTKTPFVTHLHNPTYRDKEIEAIEELFDLENFTGFTKTRDCFEQYGWRGPCKVTGALPYVPKYDIKAPALKFQRFGYTGRFCYNKGLAYYPLVAFRLLNHWAVDIHGACFTLRGPCLTFLMAEALEQLLGYKVELHIPAEEREKLGDKNPVMKPFPWTAARPDSVIRYHGPYHPDLPAERFATFSVFAALTISSFQRTMFEYTTLENMDLGALGVISMAQYSEIAKNFAVNWVKITDLGSHLTPKVIENKDVINSAAAIGDAVNDAAEAIENGRCEEAVQVNRAALRKYHDPKITAQAILDVASM